MEWIVKKSGERETRETSIDRKRNRRIYRGALKGFADSPENRAENPRQIDTDMSDDAISRNNTEYRSIIRCDCNSNLFETR
jgi:hypothetical protein